jgi:hypothetical protein
MAAPRQMTAQTLNALKGWPQPAAVDFHTEFDPDVFDILDRVPAGSVVHLNDDGLYALGVGTLSVMPLFMFNASDDPDVVNEAPDPATEKGAWVAINPTGQAMSLVAIGAYELISTQFVSGTYNPNDPLTSAIAGADAGKLAVGTLYTDMIVGIVSRGVVDNGYEYDAVAFWPFPVFPNP